MSIEVVQVTIFCKKEAKIQKSGWEHGSNPYPGDCRMTSVRFGHEEPHVSILHTVSIFQGEDYREVLLASSFPAWYGPLSHPVVLICLASKNRSCAAYWITLGYEQHAGTTHPYSSVCVHFSSSFCSVSFISDKMNLVCTEGVGGLGGAMVITAQTE